MPRTFHQNLPPEPRLRSSVAPTIQWPSAKRIYSHLSVAVLVYVTSMIFDRPDPCVPENDKCSSHQFRRKHILIGFLFRMMTVKKERDEWRTKTTES